MSILYEDDDILVLDKPAGITVNRSDTTKGEYTVQDFVLDNFKFRISNVKSEGDFYKRAGIVHRIDKETSGILVVAKNRQSFENLQAQFKERKVEKTYVALVHGRVVPEKGEIAVPVGRLPWNRKRFGVLAGGKPAVTRYEVLSVFSPRLSDTGSPNRRPITETYSLVCLFPKTGRTHQIRVHLKYINHPIFGDSLYGGRKTAREDRRLLQRVFLHASKISFVHPKTGKKVTFESKLPKELEKTLEIMKNIYRR